MSAAGPFRGSLPFFFKGDFKGLVLRLLEDRPMHGYEIIKAIEERSRGFYKPSAGAIYPALRTLLRRGLVSVSGEERRKTYRITSKGRAYLRSRRKEIERRFQAYETSIGPERAALFREVRATMKLLGPQMQRMTPAQADELRKLIAHVRGKIETVVSERG